MIGSLWNGFSGIITHEKAINVEANNSANVNTIGYKGSTISFQDLLYGSAEKGSGVTTDLISKRFVQGAITQTGNRLDVAIEGDGYFIAKNEAKNETFYTRTGDFIKGVDGTLQTPYGLKILGTPVREKELILSDEKFPTFGDIYDKFISSTTIINKEFLQTINTATTDYHKTATDIRTSGQGFKTKETVIEDVVELLADYRAKIELYEGSSTVKPKKSTKQIEKFTFSDIQKGVFFDDNTLSMVINNKEVVQRFSKNDNPQEALNKFADKLSKIIGIKATADDKGSITVETMVPGRVDLITYAALNSTNAFKEIISEATLGEGKGLVDSSRDALKEGLELANAKFIELTDTIRISQEETLNLEELQLNPVTLNLYDIQAGELDIQDGGGIYISNGKNKFLVGKLETSLFRDDNELEIIGESLFKETPASGKPRNAILRDKIVARS